MFIEYGLMNHPIAPEERNPFIRGVKIMMLVLHRIRIAPPELRAYFFVVLYTFRCAAAR